MVAGKSSDVLALPQSKLIHTLTNQPMTVTTTYLYGLGSFLDEKQITFFNNGDDTITFNVGSASHAFDLANEFHLWRYKTETE